MKEKKIAPSLVPIFFKVVVIALVLHIVLGVVSLYKKIQMSGLDKKWATVESQFKVVDSLKTELRQKRKKADAMGGLLTRKRYWTDFFNKINQATPQGLWLNHLSISDQGLVIEGSVFSFNKDQISLVNQFFGVLKKDVFFRENFKNFSLDSVQRRTIKQYEILDFVLSATLDEEQT